MGTSFSRPRGGVIWDSRDLSVFTADLTTYCYPCTLG